MLNDGNISVKEAEGRDRWVIVSGRCLESKNQILEHEKEVKILKKRKKA